MEGIDHEGNEQEKYLSETTEASLLAEQKWLRW